MEAKHRSGGTLDPETIEAVGSLLEVLAEPKRIAILQLLRGGEMIGLDIAQELAADPRNISHHLKILRAARIISRSRRGRVVFYAIDDWSALWLIEQAARALSESDS